MDAGCIAALRTPDNNTQDTATYHLSIMVLLFAGAFDDLASIIDHAYGLRLPLMRKVLTRRQNGRSYLLEALADSNPLLSTMLETQDSRDIVRAIYEIRDEIAHRSLPHPISIHNSQSGRLAGSIVLPMTPVEIVARLTGGGDPPVNPYPGGAGLAMAEFSWIIQSLATLQAHFVNELVMALCGARSGDVCIPDNFGHQLGWECEPLLFG